MRNLPSLERIALLIVLLLAAQLRLGWLGTTSFAFDEAYVSLSALQMARGGQIATLGMPSSVGAPNLPAAIWIFSLPYFISTDPRFATAFVGVLGVLAVWGVWWLARKQWGSRAGLIAALFLAASPYAVLYARSIWAQNLLPVMTLGWIWSAWKAVSASTERAAGRWIACSIVVAGFTFQVHYAGIALLLATLWLFIRYRWWNRWRAVAAGSVVVLLPVVPTVWRIFTYNSELINSFRRVVAGSAQIDLTSVGNLLTIGLGRSWGNLVLGDLDMLSAAWLPSLLAGGLLTIGLVALLGNLTRNHATRNDHRFAEILALSVLLPALWLIRHTTPSLPHYQLVALPGLALLAGAGSSSLRLGRRANVLLATTAVLAAIWSVQLGQSLWQARTIETPHGLGTPLAVSQAAAESVPSDLPVILFTHGDDPAVDGEAAVFSVLWWGRPYRIVNGETQLILPATPAWLMSTIEPFQAWEELQAAGLAEQVRITPRRPGALPFVATYYDGLAAPAGFNPIGPVQFADGVDLEGWRARKVGTRLRISTLWRVVQSPPIGTFQQFHHLRTESTLEGQPYKISDVPLSVQRWKVGDRLIVMGDFLPETAGTYWVDIGHYSLPDLARVEISGQGPDRRYRLGPISWP